MWHSSIAVLVLLKMTASSTMLARPSSVAPYLNIETIQGIATGYLQIQPGAVSAAALLELDEEDIDPNV
nr:unnamed protein product [Digitaria exilis]